jgi:type IX secretion system PorP/SprF family membrane protein
VIHFYSKRLRDLFFRRAKVLLLFLIALWGTKPANAQYYQFSQYNFTGQRINPAMTGNSRFAQLDLITRSQKTGGDFSLNSNFLSVALPLLNPSTGLPWSGVGLSVVEDHAAGIYKTFQASASYAIHVQLGKYQQLSLGAKYLYQSSQLNFDGFTTGSQFVSGHGFNNGLSSGESFQEARSHLSTFSSGLYWQQADRKGNILGYWGFSFFDFNKPKYSLSGSPAYLASTFVFTGGVQVYKDKDFAVFPEVLFTSNAGTRVLNAGARFSFDLKPTPNHVNGRVDLLTKYVIGRSGIVGVQLHKENFSFGLSYDFPVLYQNVSNLGAIEVGLTIHKLMETKKRKEAKRRQLEKQKMLTKNKLLPKPVAKKVEPIDSMAQIVATPPSEIEIVKTDTTTASGKATAGKISQEPFMVEKITLHFHFEYNSVDLDDETEDFLSQLSVTLQQDKKLKVKVVGHTDNIGSDKFNQKLSQRRADAVKNFLTQKGVESTRMESLGKGMMEPLNPNDTEENQAKNRRVEILIYRE